MYTRRGARNLALSVDDLTVAYDEKPAIWDIDLAVPEGVLMGVVGPNGAGKSTLIKAVLNLIPRAAGTCPFMASPTNARARWSVTCRSGAASTGISPPPCWMSSPWGCMASWAGSAGRANGRTRIWRWHALEQVGLVDFADRQISQLSGGQQQRAFLARALVQDAQIYFMDEPFAAVDAVTENAIVSILQALNKRGKTVLVVHHDLQTVAQYFDWVTLLNVEVIASGPRPRPSRPRICAGLMAAASPTCMAASERHDGAGQRALLG